ncbi:hypothetical protein DL96DRAFT_1554655 [Flagelloscypha sp. PMI_526]|nr:hypothetical protein DL96DRAFT_1554655 [Flagelloscypha sp. PMI_526]
MYYFCHRLWETSKKSAIDPAGLCNLGANVRQQRSSQRSRGIEEARVMGIALLPMACVSFEDASEEAIGLSKSITHGGEGIRIRSERGDPDAPVSQGPETKNQEQCIVVGKVELMRLKWAARKDSTLKSVCKKERAAAANRHGEKRGRPALLNGGVINTLKDTIAVDNVMRLSLTDGLNKANEQREDCRRQWREEEGKGGQKRGRLCERVTVGFTAATAHVAAQTCWVNCAFWRNVALELSQWRTI